MILNATYCLVNYLYLWPTVVYIVFIICFIIQISFYTFLHTSKIYSKKKKTFDSDDIKSVSVIIAARNEAENLKKFLPKVLDQEYKSFEVIVVDDNSEDNTQTVLKDFTHKYPNLRYFNTNKSEGKKNALTLGISESKYDYLLFTDSDCHPLSRFWIKEMSNCFNDNAQIILGYGAYENNHRFAESFISYDTYQIALQYFSASSVGVNYMAVGRNLAYKKQLWLSVNGFESHKDILSGDDDLFIADAANADNVGMCVNRRAFTYSEPKKTINEYIRQKARHISTSKHYSSLSKLFSSVEMISRTIFFMTFIPLLFTDIFWYAIPFFIFRIVYLYLIGKYTRKQFNIKIRFYCFVLFDIFAPVFYLMVLFKRRFIYKSKTW